MTIIEIAEKAGVSTATVSRFLNNGPVKEETKRKLEHIIYEAKYIPESFAHRMINNTGSAKSVALITHAMSNLYFGEFAEKVVRLYNTRDTICYINCGLDIKSEYIYLMDAITKNVSGIILHDPAEVHGLLELYNKVGQRIPMVIVHSALDNVNVNSITVDQKNGMKEVMQYFFNLGHTRIAHVSGGKASGYSFDIKREVWQRELKQKGIDVPPQDYITVEDPDSVAGVSPIKEVVLEYLKQGNRPTAFFTANDTMALGTIAALEEMHLHIPQDVSLISHDNTKLAESLNLTSLDMKIESVALTAVDLLDYAIKGNDSTPRHISIVPTIVERASCRSIL